MVHASSSDPAAENVAPLERRFNLQLIIEQFLPGTHPIRLFARTETIFPTLADRPNFYPLNKAHTVPEILIAGPGECLLAGPVDATEQGIELWEGSFCDKTETGLQVFVSRQPENVVLDGRSVSGDGYGTR